MSHSTIVIQCDVEESQRNVKSQAIEDYCRSNSYVGFYETSAKENKGISDAMHHLITRVIFSVIIMVGNFF